MYGRTGARRPFAWDETTTTWGGGVSKPSVWYRINRQIAWSLLFSLHLDCSAPPKSKSPGQRPRMGSTLSGRDNKGWTPEVKTRFRTAPKTTPLLPGLFDLASATRFRFAVFFFHFTPVFSPSMRSPLFSLPFPASPLPPLPAPFRPTYRRRRDARHRLVAREKKCRRGTREWGGGSLLVGEC